MCFHKLLLFMLPVCVTDRFISTMWIVEHNSSNCYHFVSGSYWSCHYCYEQSTMYNVYNETLYSNSVSVLSIFSKNLLWIFLNPLWISDQDMQTGSTMHEKYWTIEWEYCDNFSIVKSCHILSLHETWLDWKLGSHIRLQNISISFFKILLLLLKVLFLGGHTDKYPLLIFNGTFWSIDFFIVNHWSFVTFLATEKQTSPTILLSSSGPSTYPISNI